MVKPARLAVLTAVLTVPPLAALVAAPSASPDERATGRALAYEREGPEGRRGEVRVSGHGSRARQRTAVSASTAGGRGTAAASARAEPVNLFSGLVTASSVQTAASATEHGTATSGQVADLAVEGKPLAPVVTRARTYDLGGYGRLEVLSAGEHSIAGLRLTLSRDYKGHPAGSAITVAYASARASDGSPPAGEAPSPAGDRRADGGKARRRFARSDDVRDAAPARSSPARWRPAPELTALETARGYAFPVHAGYTYSNDWGAPRQHTGTHEGNDIYASAGTPVLAVTRGRLYRVGTRPIPGNRLWLKSQDGNTFFYGHLSAFAEEARNGAEVEAGQVIGFVGSTGDAERTPPHLHFEIHPGGGEAVNPYPFLRAWESRGDMPLAAWLERRAEDPRSRPGTLVVVKDFLED